MSARSRLPIVSAAGLLALLVVATGTGRSAADGTLRGSVATALRPSTGSVSTVRAIAAESGTVAASMRIGTRGTFRLAVPPGIYLVVVEKISRRAPSVTGFGRLARVERGRSSVLPTIAPGSAVARRTIAGVTGPVGPERNASAPAAGGQPAVAVKIFRGTGPEAILARGLSDMIVTDIVGSRCYVVVEWARRADVLREIHLQQSRRVDPSTRVTPGRLIPPTIFVEGSLATTESSSSWSIRAREIASGRVIASDSGRAPNIIAASTGIAKRLQAQLEKELCGRFTGTFSGKTREGAGGFGFEYSFSGTVTFARNDNADTRPGFTSYTIEKIAFRTTATLSGMCTGSASESVSLGRNDQPGNTLHIAREATPGKGRRYEISFTVERPAKSILKASCSGTTVDYPWSLVAQVIATPAALYTDASASRLRGTHNVAGTPITYTWDLRRGG